MTHDIDLPLSIERFRNSFRLVDREQFIIAYMEDGPEEAIDAQSAYIIRAVNNHDALVAALRATLVPLNVAFNAEENPFGVHHNDAEDARSMAELALAALEQ